MLIMYLHFSRVTPRICCDWNIITVKASPTICQNSREIIKIIAHSHRQHSFCFFFNSWLLSAQLPQGVNQWSLSRSFVQLFGRLEVSWGQSVEFLLTKSKRETYLITCPYSQTMEAFYYGLVLCGVVWCVYHHQPQITMPVFTAVLWLGWWPWLFFYWYYKARKLMAVGTSWSVDVVWDLLRRLWWCSV